MTKRNWLTDEEVEKAIEELKKSPHVRLARKELRLKYKYRQKLYQLRNLEKRGQFLASQGITMDSIDEMLNSIDEDIEEETEE